MVKALASKGQGHDSIDGGNFKIALSGQNVIFLWLEFSVLMFKWNDLQKMGEV